MRCVSIRECVCVCVCVLYLAQEVKTQRKNRHRESMTHVIGLLYCYCRCCSHTGALSESLHFGYVGADNNNRIVMLNCSSFSPFAFCFAYR